MKSHLKKKFRMAALLVSVVVGSVLIASPAFSWGRHPAPGPHASIHVRGHGDAIGAIITTGIIAGLTFSLIDSAGRAPAPRCEVVSLPGSVAGSVNSRTAMSGSVIVTAQMLNVRSGPSLGDPAVRQVPNGTVLSIQGNAPGWYYVKTADNQYGWVMTQYTALLGYSAAG